MLTELEALLLHAALGIASGLVASVVYLVPLARLRPEAGLSARSYRLLVWLLGAPALFSILFVTARLLPGGSPARIAFLLGAAASLVVLVPAVRTFLSRQSHPHGDA